MALLVILVLNQDARYAIVQLLLIVLLAILDISLMGILAIHALKQVVLIAILQIVFPANQVTIFQVVLVLFVHQQCQVAANVHQILSVHNVNHFSTYLQVTAQYVHQH